MKTMSKLLALIVAVAMVLSLLPTAVFAVEESAADASAAVSQEENERQQEEDSAEEDGTSSDQLEPSDAGPEAEQEKPSDDAPEAEEELSGEDARGKVQAQDGTTTNVALLNGTGYSTLEAAIADATSGQTVVLQENISVDISLAEKDKGFYTVNQAITIDGGSHTITVAAGNSTGGDRWDKDNGRAHLFNVTANGVTIQNLTIDGGSNAMTRSGINVYHASDVVLDTVTVKNCSVGVTVNASTVTATNLTTSNNKWSDSDSQGVNVDKGTASFTLVSGSISEPRPIWVENSTTGMIQSGTFTVDPTSIEHPATLASNVQVFRSGNDFVAAHSSSYAAKVDSVGYTTLEAAVQAADGKTVTLLNDVTLSSRVDVNASGSVIIDLNGKTIQPTATCANGSAFNIQGGTVTITNGTLDGTQVKEVASANDTNKVTIDDGICLVTVRNGATLTLSDITATINSRNGCCVYPFAGGKVYITGGTYTNKTTEPYQYNANAKALLLNQANEGATHEQLIFVSGGIFQGYNPALGDETNSYVKTFLAEGCKSVDNGDGSWTVEQPLHTFNYTNPDVRWRVINGEMKAIFIYSCIYCDETDTAIVSPTSSDNGTTWTYTATDAYDNTETLEKETGYTVTVPEGVNQPKTGTYAWGEKCTLTAGSAKAWYIGSVSNANLVAIGTNTYIFAVTDSVNIVTDDTTETKRAVVRATLTSDKSKEATFNAKWSIPTGTSVDSVTIYRGFTETDSSNITTDVLKSKGQPHNVNLLVWNGDYTLHLTDLTKKYQYAMIEIVYTDSSGLRQTLRSAVKKIAVTGVSS